MALTTNDIHALQHALGISDGQAYLGESEPAWRQTYRNNYATEPDDPKMLKLVAIGLMRRGRTIPGGLTYFHVTECGEELARQELPERPKLTRGQKRYQQYLNWNDATGGTFKEFLKRKEI